jgi:carbamoyltransferase
MNIIGINYYHNGSSAALLQDGLIKLAIAEERLNRIKNSSKFPLNSIKLILSHYNLTEKDINFYCINTSGKFINFRKFLFICKNFNNLLSFSNLQFLLREGRLKNLNQLFYEGIPKNKIIYIDHHLSHLESAFLISNFDECVSLSLDGSGDFTTGSFGFSKNNKTQIHGRFDFPNSLGIFYQAFTQFIGFKNFGDEYKMMGLSAYGTKNIFLKKKISDLILYSNLTLQLNTKFFDFAFNNKKITYNDEIYFNDLFADSLQNYLNIKKSDTFVYGKDQADIAFAVQEVYEDIFISILNDLYKKYSNNNLCFSGGCALNSKANGKIKKNTKFNNIFIPSEPSDSGAAVGAALSFYYNKNSKKKKLYQPNPYLGSELNNNILQKQFELYRKNNQIKFYKFKSNLEMYNKVADVIIEKNVVGWFQDRMEFGPRALGNRSILMDPRNSEAKNILNLKIKLRESYRPFAPSILEEYLDDWFENANLSPYMNFVFDIKKEKRTIIPAVCHVDGTGRVQTVNSKDNEKFYGLINSFFQKTGVPILINTSFNENEPIINTPQEAIETFLRTQMDYLVIQDYFISRV